MFTIRRKETARNALRRLILFQIDAILTESVDSSLPTDKKIHQARKRGKMIRALLRMARPSIAHAYRQENDAFRDAARSLAESRDAAALLETAQKLQARYSDEQQQAVLAGLVQALTTWRDAHHADEAELLQKLEAFCHTASESRARIVGLQIERKGFDVFREGLKRSYGDGRRRMKSAYADAAEEDFHEWRKEVKHHRYQMEVLRKIWKPLMSEWHAEVLKLSDLLGEEHDLSVLLELLQGEKLQLPAPEHLDILVSLCEQRRQELRTEARPLGRRVYAEKPGDFIHRIHAYWCAWRK